MQKYKEQQRPIVYLDESGFKCHAYRAYGYSVKGQPCHGIHNWQLKHTTNALAAWCDEKILAPYLIDSTVNSDVFYAWTKDGLIPELPDKSVIVMDNATFHKRGDIIEIVQEAGHDILWLPPYSPDLNPIEEVWAWVKSARKRWKIDCIEKLFFYFCWIINEAYLCDEKLFISL